MIKTLLDWLYPPECMVCGEIIPLNKPKYLCENCQDKLVYIGAPICQRCGVPLPGDGICGYCHEKVLYYDRHISLLSYEDPGREVIHKFKYGGRASFGEGLGKLMAGKMAADYSPILAGGDYVIPVPVHKNKLRKRGYNQSALLAYAFGETMGIPVAEDMVFREKDTIAQSLLASGKKWDNVKDAFAFNNEYHIAGMCILLIDDIYTTGSTMQAVSKNLKENGAETVIGVSLCLARIPSDREGIEHLS